MGRGSTGAEMEGASAGVEGVRAGAGEARTGALSDWVIGWFAIAVDVGYPDVGGMGWADDMEGSRSVV